MNESLVRNRVSKLIGASLVALLVVWLWLEYESSVESASAGEPLVSDAIEAAENDTSILAADVTNSPSETEYVPNVILVVFNPELSSAEIDLQIKSIGGKVVQHLERSGVYSIELPKDLSEQSTIDKLVSSGVAAIAERDQYVYLTRLPNDPRLSEQWGLHSSTSNQADDPDINASEAWDVTTGGRQAVILIIDSGVDVEHPDLAENIWINQNEIPGNLVDDDGNGFIDDYHGVNAIAFQPGVVSDTNGHGTHVAGIIGAVGNNSIGVSGVAWETQIAICRAFQLFGGATTSAILYCFEYAEVLKENGTNLVATNNSWGGIGEGPQLVQDAIARQNQLGILTIAAAGNSGLDIDQTPFYPAGIDSPNVISVAASDEDSGLAFFSNYGSESVDLAAPGVNILSTLRDDRYGFFSGTSMATPFVTGAAALIASADLTLSAAQIKDRILSTVAAGEAFQGRMQTNGKLNLDLPIPDADGDGMADAWETLKGLNPFDSNDGGEDPDQDGLTNLQEYFARTEPFNSDTDNDGLSDGSEVNTHNTEPLNQDTDNDGLSDGNEIAQNTSPRRADSDSDGLRDADELIAGTNPNNPDSDNDGLLDGWEVENNLDPLQAADATSDTDNDGLSALREQIAGTNPQIDDTDGDGLLDGAEVDSHDTDPTDADSDQDGIPDGWEVNNSTDPSGEDPFLDSDNDLFSDYAEYRARTDPQNPNSRPVVREFGLSQGDARHSGFVKIPSRGSARNTRWFSRRDRGAITPIVVEDRIFIGSQNELNTHLTLSGRNVSEQLLPDEVRAYNYIYGNGLIYFETNNRQDGRWRLHARPVGSNTNIWTLEIDFSGRVTFEGGTLYGISNNQLVAIDASNGNILWRSDVPRDDLRIEPNINPVVSNNWVAVYTASTFRVFNRNDGSIRFSRQIDLCPVGISGSLFLTADEDQNVFVTYGNCIAKFNVATQTLDWTTSSVNPFSIKLAVDFDYLYTAGSFNVTAIDKETGQVAWDRTLPNFVPLERFQNLLVTLDHLFVPSVAGVYALDLSSQTIDWRHPSTGSLAAGPDGSLIIVDDGGLTAVELNRTPDYDGDGLPNYWETLLNLDPLMNNDGQGDIDGDGLSNVDEYLLRTDPTDVDTDNDGLSDGLEVNSTSTHPLYADTDQDELSDRDEINIYSTNPFSADTDGDLIDDNLEIFTHSTNPNDRSDAPVTTSLVIESFENGLPSGWSAPTQSNGDWFITNEGSAHGQFNLRSALVDGQRSIIDWTANFSPGQIRFKARLTPGPEPSHLLVSQVGGNSRILISDTHWKEYALDIDGGTQTIRFEYFARQQQGFTPQYSQIDDLRFTPRSSLMQTDGNILASNSNELLELSGTGTIVRANVRTPGVANLAAFTQLDNHKIALFSTTEPGIGFFDVRNERTRVIPTPMRTSGQTAVSSSDYIFVASASLGGGIVKFDMSGNYISMTLAAYRYLDLTFGQDGFLYGLVDPLGQVHQIDPVTMQIQETLDTDCNQCTGISLDRSGIFFTIDSSGQVSRLTNNLSSEQATQISHPLDEVESDEVHGVVLGGYTDPPDETRGTITKLNTDLGLQFSYKVQTVFSANTSVEFTTRGTLDHDADGMPTWWEEYYGLDPNNAVDANSDVDGDSLTAQDEYSLGTRPDNPDSDDDGIPDNVEIQTHATSPVSLDTDGDNLSDLFEIDQGSNPLVSDTDGDGIEDGEEQYFGTNISLSDTDNDGMPDGWEKDNALDPLSSADRNVDLDNDGLSNFAEFQNQTDPRVADSDHDGLSDGEEVLSTLTDPLGNDSDGDLMLDGWEVQQNLDPNQPNGNIDLDNDGFSNREEYFAGSEIRVRSSTPVINHWSMYQGTAQHRGSVPIRSRSGVFQERWSRNLISIHQGYVRVSTGHNSLFATINGQDEGHLFRLNSRTGAIEWDTPLENSSYVSRPVSDGQGVFVQTSRDASVRAFQTSSGSNIYSRSISSSQLSIEKGPTLHGGALYVSTNAVNGGLASIETSTGNQNWSLHVRNFSGSTPSLSTNGTHAYILTADINGHISQVNATTGDLNYNEFYPGSRLAYWQSNLSTPIVDPFENLFLSSNNELFSFNTETQSVDWAVRGDFRLQPTWSNGELYTVGNSDLVAYDATSGNELWRLKPPSRIEYPIVSYLDHIVFSTRNRTYFLRKDDQSIEWEYDLGGELAIGEGGTLYIAGSNSQLAAISILADSDEDGMSDDWEISNGTNPNSPDAEADPDLDGLSNERELEIGTLPNNPDSDSDTMNDGWELRFRLNPLDASDQFHDFDRDQLINSSEHRVGTLPNNSDTDGDSLLDGYEVRWGLNPLVPDDIQLDVDADGLITSLEQALDTNPLSSDTDEDGLSDSAELTLGTDPLRMDTDRDGLLDGFEVQNGSDPLVQDACEGAVCTSNDSSVVNLILILRQAENSNLIENQ